MLACLDNDGTSKAPHEAMNLLLDKILDFGRGLGRFANHRLRSCGTPAGLGTPSSTQDPQPRP
jgi:hypothetical protein